MCFLNNQICRTLFSSAFVDYFVFGTRVRYYFGIFFGQKDYFVIFFFLFGQNFVIFFWSKDYFVINCEFSIQHNRICSRAQREGWCKFRFFFGHMQIPFYNATSWRRSFKGWWAGHCMPKNEPLSL